MKYKVHIPGQMHDGVQRCLRCGAQLNHGWNRDFPQMSSHWTVGHLVLSRLSGHGMKSATIATERDWEESRPCGRQK